MEKKGGDVGKEEAEKKVEYYHAEKLSLKDYMVTIPSELRPTKRAGYILGAIFILIIFIGLFRSPFGSLLSGKTDIKISIGLPWIFFEVDLENPEKIPFKFGGLLLDLILYVIIAYAIDVAINVFVKSSLQKNLRQIEKGEEATPELHKKVDVK